MGNYTLIFKLLYREIPKDTISRNIDCWDSDKKILLSCQTEDYNLVFKVQINKKHMRKSGVSVLDDISSFLLSSFPLPPLFLLYVYSFCPSYQHNLCSKIIAIYFCFKWKLRTGDGLVLVLLHSGIKALMYCRYEWKCRKINVNIWI